MSNHRVFDWVTIFLVKAGVPFIDYRRKGGPLWVKYEDIAGELIAELGRCGAQFVYSNNGSKITKRQPSWYLKTYPKQLKEPQLPNEEKEQKRHVAKHNSTTDQRPQTAKVKRKARQTTPSPKKPDEAERTRGNRGPSTRSKKKCSNCAYLDTAKCGHGGFKVCDDWRLKEKLPDYIPPMRKGGSGWGSPQPEDNWSDIPYAMRNDLGSSGSASKHATKKKSCKKRKSK